jgi:hypothetical protein
MNEAEQGLISHYTFDITFDRERNLPDERSVQSNMDISPSQQERSSPSALSYQNMD